MKTKRKALMMGLAVAMAFLPGLCVAQTFISGNISGTWSPSGNPYIVTDNATVPSDQTLTIQPGVVVWIGSGVSITANGVIQAVGSPTQRITFQAPISSQFWNTISVNGTADTNRFKYCDFQNANTALGFGASSTNEVHYCSFQNATNGIIAMGVYGGQTLTATIVNCTFSNCVSEAIYGEAHGFYFGGDTTLILTVKNSVFVGGSNGCHVSISGESIPGWGYANLKASANVFQDLSGTAFLLVVGNYAGSSLAAFINNTLTDCGAGVDATDPWDAKVQSCIFAGCTNAVTVAGSLSRGASYNDFYGNATNFTGYPGTYGTPILVNRNGTGCDLSYNIFQDPQFVATNDFHLQTISPCIDAGTPDWAYTDMCFPPSQGTSYPDLGAYGGPDACNWLDDVPVLPAQASIAADTDGVIQVSWGALPRSEYQIQYVTNLVALPATNNWINLPNGYVLATDKPTSLVVATNTDLNSQFFRVQSLGRTPGN